jgi:hypothetical protein
MQCNRVEMWVYGFTWVKFDTEKEPVRKPFLFFRRCPEEAAWHATNEDGFQFYWCAVHAVDPTCGATVTERKNA